MRCLFCGSVLLFMFHVCLYYTVLSGACSLVTTCWKQADLFALLWVMFPCVLSLSHIRRVAEIQIFEKTYLIVIKDETGLKFKMNDSTLFLIGSYAQKLVASYKKMGR